MNITLNLNSKEYQDLTRYCELNKFVPEDIVKKSYLEGFMIEKYGLLGNTGGVQEKEVVKEVIVEKRVEIPVEVIKEVVKVEYVEVPVEVIKEIFVEVPVEVVVTKTEYVSDDSQINELLLKIQQLKNKPPEVIETIKEVVVEKEITDNLLKPKMDALQITVQKLKLDNIEKDKKIKELETAITDIQKFQENKPAVYLKGSNLDNKLYK
jgi:hypothetical protein